MQRSSQSEGPLPPAASTPGERAQTDPIAALAAVFAVCVGVTAFLGVHTAAAPDRTDRDVAGPAAERAVEVASEDGVVVPERIDGNLDVAPAGFGRNVSVVVGPDRWSTGSVPPATADRASRTVTVEIAPGRIEAGRLVVRVWPRSDDPTGRNESRRAENETPAQSVDDASGGNRTTEHNDGDRP